MQQHGDNDDKPSWDCLWDDMNFPILDLSKLNGNIMMLWKKKNYVSNSAGLS
jgi:hypothetical protein